MVSRKWSPYPRNMYLFCQQHDSHSWAFWHLLLLLQSHHKIQFEISCPYSNDFWKVTVMGHRALRASAGRDLTSLSIDAKSDKLINRIIGLEVRCSTQNHFPQIPHEKSLLKIVLFSFCSCEKSNHFFLSPFFTHRNKPLLCFAGNTLNWKVYISNSLDLKNWQSPKIQKKQKLSWNVMDARKR